LGEENEKNNELTYLITMQMAKRLMDEGALNRELYEKFNSKMIQKYKPVFSTLFTDVSLI